MPKVRTNNETIVASRDILYGEPLSTALLRRLQDFETGIGGAGVPATHSVLRGLALMTDACSTASPRMLEGKWGGDLADAIRWLASKGAFFVLDTYMAVKTAPCVRCGQIYPVGRMSDFLCVVCLASKTETTEAGADRSPPVE